MPHNRYFLDVPFYEKQSCRLTGEEGHHLIRVLRTQPGDTLELINGRNQLAVATIVELTKHSATLCIHHVFQETSCKTSLILSMGIPRMNHLEWIIEKGTELNVSAFWLFPGLLSEKKSLTPSQLKRLKHLAISAMKQCGRLDLPSIEIKPSLLDWPLLEGSLFFGDLSKNTPYLWQLPNLQPLQSPVVWFIGPEKGFDPKERDFLLHTMKVIPTRLHPNILRTETAPLVALSLIQIYLT